MSRVQAVSGETRVEAGKVDKESTARLRSVKGTTVALLRLSTQEVVAKTKLTGREVPTLSSISLVRERKRKTAS